MHSMEYDVLKNLHVKMKEICSITSSMYFMCVVTPSALFHSQNGPQNHVLLIICIVFAWEQKTRLQALVAIHPRPVTVNILQQILQMGL